MHSSKIGFIALLLFILTSCSKDFFEKELIGRWRIDNLRIVQYENNTIIQDTSFSNVGFLQLREDFSGTFTIDNKTTAITFFSSNGTYAYLTIKDPNSPRSTITTYQIKSKSESNMEWENIQEQSIFVDGLPRIDTKIVTTLVLRK